MAAYRVGCYNEKVTQPSIPGSAFHATRTPLYQLRHRNLWDHRMPAVGLYRESDSDPKCIAPIFDLGRFRHVVSLRL